jgi:hypothetical protein
MTIGDRNGQADFVQRARGLAAGRADVFPLTATKDLT